MARRSGSLLIAALVLVAVYGLASLASSPAFVAPPALTKVNNDAAGAAALAVMVAATPEAAHAAQAGYAFLQLGWAVFILSLGPALLFWIYFNKPELL